MDVDAEWIQATEKHVESQVVFELLDEMWFVEVLLDDPAASVVGRVFYNLVVVSTKVDTLSLGEVIRFHYVDLSHLPGRAPVLVYELILELTGLHWHDPSLREEFELVREHLLHLHQVSSHGVLSRDDLDSRELAHFLVGLHLAEVVRRDAQIVPTDVPDLGQFLVGLALDDTSVVVLGVLFEPETTAVPS